MIAGLGTIQLIPRIMIRGIRRGVVAGEYRVERGSRRFGNVEKGDQPFGPRLRLGCLHRVSFLDAQV